MGCGTRWGTIALAWLVGSPAHASTLWFPGYGEFGTVLYEASWPLAGDGDFNDVVLRYNYTVHGSYNVPDKDDLELQLHVGALGGTECSGIGLHLPVPVAKIGTAHAWLGTPGSTTGRPCSDRIDIEVTQDTATGEAVLWLTDDIRADLCGGAAGPLNTEENGVATACRPLSLNVSLLNVPVPGAAPYDLFVYRCDDRSRQIHRPGYYAVDPVDDTRFGTGHDGSDGPGGTTWYVQGPQGPVPGLPWALTLGEGLGDEGDGLGRWPEEQVGIASAMPRILEFADGSADGDGGFDFYKTGTTSWVWDGGLEPDGRQEPPLADCEPADLYSSSAYWIARDGHPGSTGGGGGHDGDTIRVGGWGDTYWSAIAFDITLLPPVASSATVDLYMLQHGAYSPYSAKTYVQYITEPWPFKDPDWGTGPDNARMWRNDWPSFTSISGPHSTPVGSWLRADVTSQFNDWQRGILPFYGINISPVHTSNQYDVYPSYGYADGTKTPRMTVVADPSVIVHQPDDTVDGWTNDTWPFAASGPPGGLDDAELRVGGWDADFRSLIRFDLADLPGAATEASLEVFCLRTTDPAPDLRVGEVTSPWDADRLTWPDRPGVSALGAAPTPVAGQWVRIDVTDLYNDWRSFTADNHGVELSTDDFDRHAVFASAGLATEPRIRPRLVVHPAAGVTLGDVSGLEDLVEGDPTPVSVRVSLTTPPTAPVTVTVTSGDPTESAASATLVFTSADHDALTFDVVAVDDDLLDGDVAHTIDLVVSSSDPDYHGIVLHLPAATASDDAAGAAVAPVALTLDEDGGADTFEVVLGAAPNAGVAVALVAPSQLTLSTPTLTFDAQDWDEPKTVTVSSIDDDVADGDEGLTVTLGFSSSADADYAALADLTVAVTRTDDDRAGVVVAPSSFGVLEGDTASYRIRLTSQPTGPVSLDLTSGDPTLLQVPARVTLDADWSSGQTVTVTALDNHRVGDASITVSHAIASAPTEYASAQIADTEVQITDDDAAGIVVDALVALFTGEEGAQATFTVALATEPAAAVQIAVSSGDDTEGAVSPAVLTFDDADWDQPRTVTLTGVDDDVDDGDQAWTVALAPAVSDDPDYAGRDAIDVDVVNLDDDIAAVVATPDAGLVTSEDGTTDTFTVVLTTRPVAPITLAVTSDDPDEASASPSSLTFDDADWDQPQTVTVTGNDDAVDDGVAPFSIRLDPSGTGPYDAVPDLVIAGTNASHGDVAGLALAGADALVVSEDGGTDTFTLGLASQPVADVAVELVVDPADEASAAPARLVFTPASWAPRTVTVTGLDDATDDGDVAFQVTIASVTSDDPLYAAIDPSGHAVHGVNQDDDVSGWRVDVPGALVTTEAGDSVTIGVALAARPQGVVRVAVRSGDPSEGVASPRTLVFTPDDWSAPREVEVVGRADGVDDGDQTYTVTLSPATPGPVSDLVWTFVNTDLDAPAVDDTAVDLEPGGCGCATGGAPAPWGLLLGLLVLRRRGPSPRRAVAPCALG